MIINWQTNPSVDTRSVYHPSVQGLQQPPHRKAGAEDQAVHLLYYPTGPPKGSAAGRSHDCPRRIADRHDVERPKQTCTLTPPQARGTRAADCAKDAASVRSTDF